MSQPSSFRLTTVLCTGSALVWALPATAQISADDVVTNAKALYDSLGASHSATYTRDGAVMRVEAERLEWALPMGVGTAGVTLGDYMMTENGDGSVTILYPMPYIVTIDGSITGEGSGSAELVMTASDDFTSIATGDPGAISYLSRTGAFDIGLGTVVLPDAIGMEGMEVAFSYSAESSETLTRVVEDSLVVVFSQSEIGPSATVYSASGPDFSTTTEASYAATTSITNMGLIPGGVDLLNLATALRGGMYLSAESTSDGSESFSETILFGSLSDRQDVVSGPGSFALRFDRDGLGVDGSVRDIFVTIEQPFITDVPFGFDLAGASASLQLPLLADQAAQDFVYAVGLDSLRLGQPVWALFDPAKQLDRSPASLGIDISGSVINKVDWLDILSLEGLNIENTLPADITSLSIADLSLAALGARISGQGAFTFDAGDTVTYPGVPRPTGEAALDATGVNRAIDALADAGVIPSDALFGLRMGLGMVSVPGTEPDSLTSRIQMTADGQIIANGQRLR